MWRNLAVQSKPDNKGKVTQKKEKYAKYQKKMYAKILYGRIRNWHFLLMGNEGKTR